MVDLTPGDYIYQSDQELFLVVSEVNEDTYHFSVHGWREIDKDRIDEYIDNDKSNVHKQGEIEQLIDTKGDDDTQQKFNRLKQLFAVYEDAEFADDGPHSRFALEE